MLPNAGRRNHEEIVMTKKSWAKLGMVLLLVGCAAQWPATGGDTRAGWDGKFVPLSAEATKEIAGQFGGVPPKAILAINNEGKVVVFQPDGTQLAFAKFPLEVGNLVAPPQNITIIGTSHSPVVQHICVTTISGVLICF
jgi:hypothetical protein